MDNKLVWQFLAIITTQNSPPDSSLYEGNELDGIKKWYGGYVFVGKLHLNVQGLLDPETDATTQQHAMRMYMHPATNSKRTRLNSSVEAMTDPRASALRQAPTAMLHGMPEVEVFVRQM